MNTLVEKQQQSVLDPLCQANVSVFWGGAIAEILSRLGVKYAILPPGSRSTPLLVGFGVNEKIESISILDERSAAFFALGLAKKTNTPVALICTSGTAAANFYPAIIEARMTKVPLIVLTADRPPELRDCHAGQTIDQVKMYGNYPLFYKELAVPEADMGLFRYMRQMVVHAWERSQFPQAGPVHLNLPFRDPLAPVIDDKFVNFLNNIDLEAFFDGAYPRPKPEFILNKFDIELIIEEMKHIEKGLIVVGTIQPSNPEAFSKAIGKIANVLGWPVLAEGLSPIRNFTSYVPNLITRYDAILRNEKIANDLHADAVINIGDLPTSKVLRAWLKERNAKTWVIEDSTENVDLLHRDAITIRTNIIHLAQHVTGYNPETAYSNKWRYLESQAEAIMDHRFASCDRIAEAKVAWLLPQILPPRTPIFVSTSMPVRDVEFFWRKNNNAIQPYFNRGANGIDGLLSTTLGIAHEHQPSVLLIGDLSLLHDSNGFLIKDKFKGSLTIVLINNEGGGVFEFLPISQFQPIFDEYLITNQYRDFQKLATFHEIPYYKPTSWVQFEFLLSELPESGIRLIELHVDRSKDVAFRKELFKTITETIKIKE